MKEKMLKLVGTQPVAEDIVAPAAEDIVAPAAEDIVAPAAEDNVAVLKNLQRDMFNHLETP